LRCENLSSYIEMLFICKPGPCISKKMKTISGFTVPYVFAPNTVVSTYVFHTILFNDFFSWINIKNSKLLFKDEVDFRFNLFLFNQQINSCFICFVISFNCSDF
jgi:hypothetical protein